MAVRHGGGTTKIINSVKAYKPGHIVDYDAIRSLMGVMSSDRNVSKGMLTTTSAFPPRVLKTFIAPLVPTRLELMDGAALRQWLKSPRL